MSKPFFYISLFFIGFSSGGLIATISENNPMIDILRLILLTLYCAIPFLYLILLGIGIGYQQEELKNRLYAVFTKEYIPYYVTAILFLIALLVYQKANEITIYG